MALKTLEEKKAFVKQFNVFDDIFFELVAKDKDATADAEDEDVAELMDFFKNSNGIHEKFKNLSERVDELKNEESEVLVMCELVERYRAEGKAEGRAEGEEFKANEIALKLITGGLLSKEQIAAATGLSLDEINKLTWTKL